MAGNSNQLIVEVVGDTSKLRSSLNSAQRDIAKFAGRSTVHTTVLDDTLADTRRLRDESKTLAKTAADSERASDRLNSSFARTSTGALIAGVAVNVLGRNMQSLGGTVGRVGSALDQLSTGNVVGFVQTLGKEVDKDIDSIDRLGVSIGTVADILTASQDAASIGANKFADALNKQAQAVIAANNAFVDNQKIHDSTSPGAIAGEFPGVVPPKTPTRPGISAAQRNSFFDADINRLLDRAQDGSLPQQVTKLKAIEDLLAQRKAVTKDITRQLRLEDEIVAVRRQRTSVEATIASNAKQSALDAARAAEALKKQREEREKALAEARRLALQSKQFRALGFAADGSELVPGADNLRKQLGTLTNRLAGSSVNISSKLESQLDGARKVLSGKFGQVTKDSREKIAELFKTIRDEFDKGSKTLTKTGGPLTKTTQLNSDRILDGLGLGRDSERLIRARLSHFNSAGVALAGSGAGSRPPAPDVNVYLDGRKVNTVTTKHAKRSRARNAVARTGPNAGVIVY